MALRLSDYVRGLKVPEQLGINAIYAQRLSQYGPDAVIYLAAWTFGIKFWAGQDGQLLDPGRIVALVRPANQAIPEPERANYLGRAGYERYYAQLLHPP
jgi:hypothetical protein